MNLGTLGVVVSGLATVIMFVGALATVWTRRLSVEAKELRELRAVNVAALKYLYDLEVWAANRGVALPDRPKELTPEYLEGKADAGANSELARVAEALGAIGYRPGGPTGPS